MILALLVFLSYARADSALALKVRNSLTQAGCAVQMDRDIPAGSEWTSAIERMIDRSDVVVVLVSRKPSLYMRSEYVMALTKGKRVIPVAAGADLPIPLNVLQATDAAGVSRAVGCK